MSGVSGMSPFLGGMVGGMEGGMEAGMEAGTEGSAGARQEFR